MTVTQRMVILGLINETPCTGYELKKTLDHIGSLSGVPFSSLYYELKRLQKTGLIKKSGKGGSSKYHITHKGNKEFQDIVCKRLAESEMEYDSYYAASAFSYRIPKGKLKQLYKKRMNVLKQELQKVRSCEAKQVIEHGSMLRRAEALIKADINWLTGEIKRI